LADTRDAQQRTFSLYERTALAPEAADEDDKNDERMRVVAQVLELPPDLLVLRAKESLAKEELRQIERQLRDAAQIR
jgi:hypothetical protein